MYLESMKLSFSYYRIWWLLTFLTAMLVAGYFLIFSQPPQPPKPPKLPLAPYSQGLPLPALSAKNYFVLDLNSRLVLASKDADTQIYPASTTKMMTALVAINTFPLDQIVTVPRFVVEGSKAGLRPGEQVTIEKLLYALLIQSGNDAAEVLAAVYPGGRNEFIAAMNSHAAALHLANTHFKNPTGLDEAGHFSSAADLTRLAVELESHPYLARIVSTENAVISVSDSTVHVLTNVNQLLGSIPGVLGIKTGFTDLAGQSLVTLINRNGHPVYIALMGSTDRFADTKSLIDWVYSNYQWK